LLRSLPHASRDKPRSSFIGAKRIGQPVDAARVERDDIEAARGQRAAPCREEMLRGMHESRALARIDARRGIRKAPASSRSHFDEHERAAFVEHDEIDLAAPARHVARDEAHALPSQKFERVRFENIAERFGHGSSIKVVDVRCAIARCTRVAK
jgi:hypothetical protein